MSYNNKNKDKKNTIKTKIKIIKLIPCAFYQGKVYDQLVLSELSNGERIYLFDVVAPEEMLCTNDMIGEYKDIEISVLTGPGGNYKICGEEEKMGIFHPREYKNELNHDVCGIVEEIYDEYLILDIGVGKVKVENYFPETFKFSIGDKIKIKETRVDLRKIW